MQQIFPKFGKSILLEAALGILVLQAPISCAQEIELEDTEIGLLSAPPSKGGRPLKTLKETDSPHNTSSLVEEETSPDTYTINFTNISIIEYINFVIKITKLNFIFDATELDFNVSIVSETPVSARNILSILIQVLRIHDLVVLEQDQNILITKSRSVNQIATLVSPDLPSSSFKNSPVVTRVFRIKNANLTTIAAIVKPMLSASALIEVSSETRQLIITDITTNVDKISSLLASIDAPHSSLEIDSYDVENGTVEDLIKTATLITAPLTEGNPLIFVPHPNSKTIFIISTPYLIERSLTIFEDLDVPVGADGIKSDQFFIYHPKMRSGKELQEQLKEIAQNLEISQLADPSFLQTIDSIKWVASTNSLIFTGNAASLKRVEETLASIDISTNSHLSGDVFLYKPKYISRSQIEKALQELAANLNPENPTDEKLQQAIEGMKWASESQALLFQGSPATLSRIKELIANLDTPEGVSGSGGNTFVLYKLKYASGEAVIQNLQKVSDNLKESGVPDKALIRTIEEAKWIRDNNSLLLTGSTVSLDQVKKLIEHFDIPGALAPPSPASAKSSFYIYKPLHQTPDNLEIAIKSLATDLEESGLIDPDLLQSLQTMRTVESNQTLLFTGPNAALEKVRSLIVPLDSVSPEQLHIQQIGEHTFFIYKIQHVPGDQLLIALKGVAADLQRSGSIDPNLVMTLSEAKFIKETNSLLFTGTPATLKNAEGLVRKFDQSGKIQEGEAASSATPSNFVVYTPRNQSGPDLIKILDEFQQNLAASGVVDPRLFETINNLKWIQTTRSLLISGDEPSIQKVESLLHRFDVPSQDTSKPVPTIEAIDNTSFLIYKLQYHQGDEILSALKQITLDISGSGNTSNQNLVSAINSLQWIKVTNSLLASGEPNTLSKLKDLVQNLDIPLRQVFIEILVIETNVLNTHNFGLQWGGRMQYLNRFALGSGSFPAPAGTGPTTNGLNTANGIGSSSTAGLNNVNASTTPTSTQANIPFMTGFDLGVIGDIIMHKGQSFLSLGSLVNALQTDTDSTVVMNPKVITQDNKNSTIFIGNNIPFAGSTTTITGAAGQNSTNLEYRDIGFNLSITPTIGNNDIVTMDINNDISEVLEVNIPNTSQGTSGGLNGIQTSHTSMVTRVHVPDQHFVVLTGMVQDARTRYRSAIPCLGGLPVIGAVFEENDRLNSRQNIIIFVRPYIVDTYDDYKAITDQQETLFREQAGMPVLREEFDAGLDMVKQPNNE